MLSSPWFHSEIICTFYLCIISSCLVYSSLMTFLFTAVWRCECMSGHLLPRKQNALGVLASVTLFLTQRPSSAVVVGFSNGKGTRRTGRKMSPLACLYAHSVYELSKGLLFMSVTYDCVCADGISGREALPARTFLSPRIPMEDLPLCTSPEVCTCIDGSILCSCVFLRSVLSASGKM